MSDTFMTREYLIQSAIDRIKARTYLEIGVHRGKNFFRISAPFQIAVDPNFIIGIKRRLNNPRVLLRSRFFEMTSDQFFATRAASVFKDRQLDVAFIDGLHTSEQVLADFNNCLKYLSPNGVILFHDCNPTSREAAEYGHSPREIMQKFEGKNAEWTGDVWKAIVHIRSQNKSVAAFVLDCDYGIGVARRGKPANELSLTAEQVAALTYDDLDRNRVRLLDLKPPQYWDEFIKTL